MLGCYIYEFGKIDVEIASILKKKSIKKPEEESKDLNKMKLGKIQKENWSVVYQRRVDQTTQRCIFFLMDKNLYSTTSLNYILGLTEAFRLNNVADQKCFSDMIRWYNLGRTTLMNLMPKLFKVQEHQQQ